jgi:hypothetical protein
MEGLLSGTNLLSMELMVFWDVLVHYDDAVFLWLIAAIFVRVLGLVSHPELYPGSLITRFRHGALPVAIV